MQSIVDILTALSETPLSVFLRESSWAFPAAETVHVVAVSFVVGLIAIVDLRLLGVASMGHALTRLMRDVLPWTWAAFVVAVIAGLAMFISQPVDYFINTAFRIKVFLLILAGCNMIFFHVVTFRGVADWDRSRSLPLAARLAGAASLTFWIAIVFLGRQVGFTMY